MKSRKSYEAYFDEVLKASGEILKRHGFVRRGSVFRLLQQGNCGIIEFQRSDKTSNDTLLFTLNVGVVCGELLDSETTDIHKARIIDAQLSQRIGRLLPERSDKWWEIGASTDQSLFTQGMVDLLENCAVPYVLKYLSRDALSSLWESGQSPGLTAVQRSRFLSRLRETLPEGTESI